MLDFILAHPFGFTMIAGSIASFAYASWKDGEINERERNLNSEMSKREREIHSALDKFQSQTGIDVSNLMHLATVEEDLDKAFAYQSAKVGKYVNRLIQLNSEKRKAFQTRPIITAAGAEIAKIELFAQSTEEFLIREQALCAQVAKERGLICHLTTKKVECKVVKVIDGDTFDVQVGSERIRIRAMGYDTPEVCHPKKGFGHWGIQSSEATELIVKNGKIFHVYLDTVTASKNWTNDRYGRTLAHLEVDGVLIGRTLIENGHATVVDVFPIDKDILSLYKKAEYDARLHDFGMWLDINRYKLERKPVHQQKKWNLTSVVKNEHEIDMTKSLMKDVLSSMLGKIFSKSKTGVVLHDEGCRYVKVINETDDVQLTEEMLESGKIRPCKVCNGDELVRELMNNR